MPQTTSKSEFYTSFLGKKTTNQPNQPNQPNHPNPTEPTNPTNQPNPVVSCCPPSSSGRFSTFRVLAFSVSLCKPLGLKKIRESGGEAGRNTSGKSQLQLVFLVFQSDLLQKGVENPLDKDGKQEKRSIELLVFEKPADSVMRFFEKFLSKGVWALQKPQKPIKKVGPVGLVMSHA